MKKSMVVARDGDEELSLFLEMRRREKSQCDSSLLQSGRNSVDKSSSTESLVVTTMTTKTISVPLRKSAVEKFLDSENNKSDYEWLLAVPETIDEIEEQENSMVKLKESKARTTALKPRVENIPREPVTRSSVKASKQLPRLNSSTAFSKQANTVTEPSKLSRHATRQTNSTQNSNPTSSIKPNPRASAFTRSSSVGKSVPNAKSTPVRPVSTSRTRVNSSGGDRSTGRSKISNDVSPVLMGTQMVERVVNMRKLPPPKQDNGNTSSGFGRSLSKSSLDMALRHMNIKRSSNLENPRVTNALNKTESSFSS